MRGICFRTHDIEARQEDHRHPDWVKAEQRVKELERVLTGYRRIHDRQAQRIRELEVELRSRCHYYGESSASTSSYFIATSSITESNVKW